MKLPKQEKSCLRSNIDDSGLSFTIANHLIVQNYNKYIVFVSDLSFFLILPVICNWKL